MASSSIQKNFKYDVFLSFRGEDTRKNFVDHLYHALKQRGINTYKDDEEIKKGKRISDELIRSIEDSKFHIIVFSKNYASSSWCLDELVKIMECHKTNEQTAYPVFYDVEPTEVRHQSGAVGEAFNKHVNIEAVRRWRDALEEAAGLAGRVLKNTFDGHQAKFIQKIVEEVSLEIRFSNPSIDENLIGMETRVKDVVLSLETDIDDVRFIGIKGMGGAGKTTLARAVFDQISFMYEGSSFVKNVRETSERSGWGLESLQKKILSDVLDDPNIIVKGDSAFKRMLCGRKVLVILDDVDHINQLEALASKPNWFKPGSRIIITTRDEQVLVAHKVPKNLILNVNLLSHEEATCLFNKYAFGRVISYQGYDMLSNQVVHYACGLPLTIKVLGSSLCGKDELEWIDTLERLKTIPLQDTLEILELSYKSLEEEHKKIFLDVACILKGWDKEEAIIALECLGLHARIGLKVLELKSLITVYEINGCLGMHDHIEEMGKNIVRRLHLDDPSRHSRLWNQDEIEDILVEYKGTKETRCIKVRNVNPVIVMKGIRKMKELRFLDVRRREYRVGPRDNDYEEDPLPYFCEDDADNVGEDNLYLPNSLQYLRWHGYPFKCLPIKFQANNLVGLRMRCGKIKQFWEGKEKKVLKKLRFLHLLGCYTLRSVDIELFPNLERLSLVECDQLEELHIPINHSNLRYLHLNECALRTLDLEQAQNLDTLEVEDHKFLAELRMPVESLSLKHVTLRTSMLKTIDITRYQNLETLDLTCFGLVELYLPVEKLESLVLLCSEMKTLNLTRNRNLEALCLLYCKDLLQLHMPIESHSLKTIEIIYSKLEDLNLTASRNLENLVLNDCADLLELCMPIESPILKSINISCSKLKSLDLTGIVNLESLDLDGCTDLEELHMPIESPTLKSINICYSKLKTLNLTETWNLESLDLKQCKDLEELYMPIESPKLKTVNINCPKLRSLNLTRYQDLESLDLGRCAHLVELHMPIESSKLKMINTCYSKLKSLNLARCRNIVSLDLGQCKDLVELHMPIESPKLRTINIRSSMLRTLYLGLSPCLECLDLRDCITLEEINCPVGCLSGHIMFKPFVVNQGFPTVGSLAELHLIVRSLGTCLLHPKCLDLHFDCIYMDLLPSSTMNLKKLITFGLRACTNLASFSQRICGLQHLRKLTLEGSISEVPKELDQLECLEVLTLLSTKIEHLPNSICMLKHLKFIRLKSCWSLKQLPDDIGRLECLEELYLTDCTSLRYIPNSICEIKCLKYFHLTDCLLVVKLPKEIGRLKCLKELNIQGTGISDIPESIFQLEDLLFIL